MPRQLKSLCDRTQVSDDLIEAWIWWFKTHQPAQGGVWVPHLGWVHTLIAPPTDPRTAPTTGGRERAAPPPRPDNLCFPPHEGLEAWESGNARSRGHNLTNLTAHYPETARAAPPPRERDPGTDAFPWGAWPRDAAVTRTSKQAGKALRSQGHQYARVM